MAGLNGWQIPQLNQQTLAALAEADPPRRALYTAMQQELQRSSPYVFIDQAKTEVVLRDNVKGYQQAERRHGLLRSRQQIAGGRPSPANRLRGGKNGVLALAVAKSASIMRHNLPRKHENDVCFVSHNRQNRLPIGGQLPLFLLLLNRLFQAPH